MNLYNILYIYIYYIIYSYYAYVYLYTYIIIYVYIYIEIDMSLFCQFLECVYYPPGSKTETPEASDQLADNARSAMPRMPSLDGSSSDLTIPWRIHGAGK